MEYIMLSLVLIIAVCAAGAIWDAYNVSDEEWKDMDETEDEENEHRKET